MVDLLARNWVLVVVLGGMAFMHFGMHRGHGKSGHGGGCGGGRAQDGHEPEAPSLHVSDATRRSQDSRTEGTRPPLGESLQDSPAPSDARVQVEDAPKATRSHRGCC
jgi:hypothetical protein